MVTGGVCQGYMSQTKELDCSQMLLCQAANQDRNVQDND
ncbi:hypothetical protein GBAR_LOCUS22476 [Geodia barretti]|uniref:Uncharacterized protein n=1 Tax=Geodia barretti TaxID=519541 RepID=A0AA35T4R0_GEOBA|nr:hypothetical protein GBAR_LOCUS22476 [Geodia barretti]